MTLSYAVFDDRGVALGVIIGLVDADGRLGDGLGTADGYLPNYSAFHSPARCGGWRQIRQGVARGWRPSCCAQEEVFESPSGRHLMMRRSSTFAFCFYEHFGRECMALWTNEDKLNYSLDQRRSR